MRLVMLTGGANNGRLLSQMLVRDGITLPVLTMAPPQPRTRTPRRLLRHAIGANRLLRQVWQSRRPGYGVTPQYIGVCNSAPMVDALSAARPDVILMMGGGILSSDVIRTARIGVLNAHPALLPQVRGVDVVRHAVLAGLPIAVTLHYIDEGIDTGRIIQRWLVPVLPGDDHDAIARRADHVGNLAMRWATLELLCDRELPASKQHERFPLCRTLDPARAAEADRKIAAGDAVDAYRRALGRRDLLDGASLMDRGP